MKTIFVDTNVILDLLAKREPFYTDSGKVFSLADRGEIELIVSTLSLVNTHYILNDAMKLKDVKQLISKFKVLVTSFELTDKIIELALHDVSFTDFEDGIQYHTAIESNCSCILTRNQKDFRHSSIPVFSPKEFISNIEAK